MSGIRAIKALRLDEGAQLLEMAAEALVRRGAKSIIMGCTEIPIALGNKALDVPLVDSTLALAQACVAWAGAPAQTASLAQGSVA